MNDYAVDFDGWPDLPPTRVIGTARLASLKGAKVWVVHHYTKQASVHGMMQTVGISEATVYPWTVGPLVLHVREIGRSSSASFLNYHPDMEDRYRKRIAADPTCMELLIAEHGDFGNDKRPDATFLDVFDYNVCDRSPVYPCNGLFENQRDAELWAVQAKLSFEESREADTMKQRRLIRKVVRRHRVKNGLRAAYPIEQVL